MRRYVWLVLVVAAAVALSVTLPPRSADAIPAFARKYRFSCTTCHAPFPRLKAFGEEFAARGFRLEDPAQEPARAEVDTGDPLLKLAREFPIAVRLEGYGAYREGAAAEADFEYPWVFKILSGGPISDKLSYYFYFITEKNVVEGLEDAFLQYSGLFGSKVDLIFGQFQVSDPLFKRELRLERTDYRIYQTRVGAVQANLTYDRGVVLSAAPGGIDVVVELVNGNGIPKGEFDRDDHKNVALRLARTWGGVRLGVFGYWGREDGDNGRTESLTYVGPDFSAAIGDRWQLNVQYLERRDDDPFFTGGAADDVVTRGGFAELHFFPRGQDGRWVLSGLYNRVDSDDPAAEAESVSATLNYLVARNVRLLTEVGRDLASDRNEASLGLVAAF
jgi:hypothetical protein